jgi:hypothetical protein
MFLIKNEISNCTHYYFQINIYLTSIDTIDCKCKIISLNMILKLTVLIDILYLLILMHLNFIENPNWFLINIFRTAEFHFLSIMDKEF